MTYYVCVYAFPIPPPPLLSMVQLSLLLQYWRSRHHKTSPPRVVSDSLSMATGKNTPEYQTVLTLVENLRLAVRPNLVSLGGALMARGLISPENEPELRNTANTVAQRAARCVELVQEMIEQDASNYNLFIEVLESDKLQYRAILSKLQETYAAKRQQGS